MRIHRVKILSKPLASIRDGKKLSEYRLNDRDFCVGDIVILEEYFPPTDETQQGSFGCGGAIVKLSHVQRGGEFGLPENYCVLSFRLLHAE